MQIRFPRKIRLGFRPVYGLTIRQLVYLALFGVAGGLMILAGPFQGASILVRALIGVAIMVAGLALAFLRVAGLSVDEWLPIAIRYFVRPRKRVWRKREATRPIVKAPSPPAPAVQPADVKPRIKFSPNPDIAPITQDQRRVVTSAIIAIDAFILLVLGGATLYFRERGFAEVRITLEQLLR
ncbi:MAG: PrgI family protein [Anaerolineae bacterium]|nr:PrgI family protein [Anaerolineae bacterium]